MASARFEQLLAGTAVALALALTPYAGSAIAASEAEIAAAVPMPESADLPPPSIKDVIAPADAAMQPEAPAAAAPKPEAPVDAAAATPAAAETTNSTPAPRPTAPSSTPRRSRPIRRSSISFATNWRPENSTASLAARRSASPSRRSTQAATSRRSGSPTAQSADRAKAAAAYLAGVDADGLDPSEYPVPQIKAGMEPEALAEAEIKFTDAVLTFARHAMAGRVHYSRVAADIVYDLAKPDPANVLARIAKAQDAGAALDSLNPPQPQYKALKAKLAEMRKGADDVAKPMIAQGPVLKYSKDKKGKEVLMEDPRVPALRERFGLKSPDGDTTYDKALSDTIAKFQKENGINASGQLNAGDARGHQRAQAREDRRHHHRQHGALALDAARPRPDLRDGQHSGLHACASCATASSSGRPRSWSASPTCRRRCSARR